MSPDGPFSRLGSLHQVAILRVFAALWWLLVSTAWCAILQKFKNLVLSILGCLATTEFDEIFSHVFRSKGCPIETLSHEDSYSH